MIGYTAVLQLSCSSGALPSLRAAARACGGAAGGGTALAQSHVTGDPIPDRRVGRGPGRGPDPTHDSSRSCRLFSYIQYFKNHSDSTKVLSKRRRHWQSQIPTPQRQPTRHSCKDPVSLARGNVGRGPCEGRVIQVDGSKGSFRATCVGASLTPTPERSRYRDAASSSIGTRGTRPCGM